LLYLGGSFSLQPLKQRLPELMPKLGMVLQVFWCGFSGNGRLQHPAAGVVGGLDQQAWLCGVMLLWHMRTLIEFNVCMPWHQVSPSGCLILTTSQIVSMNTASLLAGC
jgi:hypothetical protein